MKVLYCHYFKESGNILISRYFLILDNVQQPTLPNTVNNKMFVTVDSSKVNMYMNMNTHRLIPFHLIIMM